MPFPLWIALILCNIVWALNPTQAKVLIHEVGPVWAAWVRYFGAFATYCIWRSMEWLTERRKAQEFNFFIQPRSSSEFLTLALLSLCAFVFSPLAQMLGLVSSTAVNNALLVALEPLFTVGFGWLFLRQTLRPSQWLSFPVALLGFVLLARVVSFAPHAVSTAKGDTLMALGTAGEAMFSIFSFQLLRNHRASPIFGTAVGCGVVVLSGVALLVGGFPSLHQLTWQGAGAALWIGPLGTAVTYMVWLLILERKIPVGLMALTLFVQPLVGTMAGTFFLHEMLKPIQVVGGGLILLAVALPEFFILFRKARTSE